MPDLSRVGTVLGAILVVCPFLADPAGLAADTPRARAKVNGKRFQDAAQRACGVYRAWMNIQDPATAMFPYYIGRDYWVVADSAADLYSSLIMMAHVLDPAACQPPDGKLYRTLASETQRTSRRYGALPDDYAIVTQQFRFDSANIRRQIYGSAEYARDGLVRITEIMGKRQPWYERLERIAADIMTYAPEGTPYGNIPAGEVGGDMAGKGHTVNGEMLHVLCRLYAWTGREQYLKWAERIGDYYFYDALPTNANKLVLGDHGDETLSGMADLFLLENRLGRPRAKRYLAPMRKMLDRLLEVGRNPATKMWYARVNPRNGAIITPAPIPCWAYSYFPYDVYDQATGENRYPAETEDVIRRLIASGVPGYYCDHDNFADSYECMIILGRRHPQPGMGEWLQADVEGMYGYQKADGFVTRNYSDGSFGRTAVHHMMLNSCSIRPAPWREGLELGAILENGLLHVVVSHEAGWAGKLLFAGEDASEFPGTPLDWARINEFPRWFTVRPGGAYLVCFEGKTPQMMNGRNLVGGLDIRFDAGEEVYFTAKSHTP